MDGVGIRKEVNDFKGVRHNANSHELLAVVTAVEHEGIHKALNDGHLSLAELLSGVATGRVRGVDGVTKRDVVRQGNVLDLDILSAAWLAQSDTFASTYSHLPKRRTVPVSGMLSEAMFSVIELACCRLHEQ